MRSETQGSVAIPLTDAWQHRQVRADIDLAIDRILTDVHADGAELIAALEATMALRLGEAVHAIAVQSGLAAEFLLSGAWASAPAMR